MSNNLPLQRLAPLALVPALFAVLGAGCAASRDAPASDGPSVEAPVQAPASGEAPRTAGPPPAAAPPTSASGPRVAQWTPTELQMAARGSGQLALVDGCLVLSSPDAAPLLLVFPYGAAAWDDAARALRYGDRTYRLGDRMEVGGGSVERGSDRLGDGPRDIPACAVDTLFLVG